MAFADKAFLAAPNSLKLFEAPKRECIYTKAMADVCETMHEGPNKIMHIHGMPGSGKSQIVSKVCQEMAKKGFVVWHVQCQKYVDGVANSWKELGHQLKIANLISRDDSDVMNNAIEMPSRTTIAQLLNIINRTDFPVLLAVEFEDIDDVKSSDERILKLLVEEFSSDYENVKVIIASRYDDILFSRTGVTYDQHYIRREVCGFTKEEARFFLARDDIQYSDESITSLAKELAYSPLGLLMAKNYCLEFRVSYDTYFESLGNDDSITEKEKELLKKHPDLGKNHRYEIITRLLKPTGNDDAEKMDFIVMKMMSFLNKNDIPSEILESFFREIEYSKTSRIKSSTKHLIRKLEKRVGCKRDETSENGSISLHGDVLRVLQASMSPTEKGEVLINVLFSLASILDKDNRVRKDYGFLYDLKSHIIAVSAHCSEQFKSLENEAAPTERQCEILLSLSRIHESVGFVISQHPGMRKSNEEDHFFQKAMEYLWGSVTMHTDKSTIKALSERLRGIAVKNKKALISYELNKDPVKTAEKVYMVCKDKTKSNKVLSEALRNDYRRNFPVKPADLVTMKKLGDKSGIEWESLQRELEENGTISEASYNRLVEAKLVISWKDLSQFYVVERIASILHSRGRQDNYKRDLLSDEMVKKCEWWVELGYQLCVKISERTDFNSMFDYILRANNKLPKISVNRKNESEEKFFQRITKVREMAIALQKEDRTYYEHGKIRIVSNTPYTVLNASKYLIKVNTKVHKRSVLLTDFPLDAADNEADVTYNLAIKNPTIVLGCTCLVHVGKYFAARKNFPRSFEAFEKAFQNGIEKDVKNNATRFAWALYNMLRALTIAGEDYHDERLIRNIKRRYDMTKTNGTPDEWRNRLNTAHSNAPISDDRGETLNEEVPP